MRDNTMVQATTTGETQYNSNFSVLVITRDQCIRFWTVDVPSVTSWKFHMSKRYHEDSLACMVMNAWENLPYGKINNVLGCIPKDLQLIVDDQGGNNLVQSKWGKALMQRNFSDDEGKLWGCMKAEFVINIMTGQAMYTYCVQSLIANCCCSVEAYITCPSGYHWR